MKVCMMDPLFYPYFGGTEKHVYEVSKRLVRDFRYEISILTSALPGSPPTEKLDGMEIHRSSPSLYIEKLPAFLPPPYTVTPLHALDVLRQDSDIIHIHNRFWYHLGTIAAAKLRSKRMVLTLHNAKPDGISFMTDKCAALYDLIWGHRIMEICDRIVAVSEWTKSTTVPKRLQHKCSVIHNGVDINRFDPGKDGSAIRAKFKATDGPLLLSNARLVPQKGFSYLMSAFSRLKEDYPKARLVVIGKGPLKQSLESQCTGLGVSDSVHFVTGIPEDELPLYYNACDLFVLPTLWEPCAVVFFEALASGKPVLATDVSGNPEIVTKDCGKLVPARDSDALYEEAARLLSDHRKLGEMGKAARERAVSEFSWDVVAGKLNSVYEEIMEK